MGKNRDMGTIQSAETLKKFDYILMSSSIQSTERNRTTEYDRNTVFASTTKNYLGSNRSLPLGQIQGISRNINSSYLLGDYDMHRLCVWCMAYIISFNPQNNLQE